MPRRQDVLPPERVAAVLGVRGEGSPDPGWVPRRDALAGGPGGGRRDRARRDRPRGPGRVAGVAVAEHPQAPDLGWAGQVAPGAREVATGPREAAPGAWDVAPGARDVAPGAREVAPGAREPAFDDLAPSARGRHRRPVPPRPAVVTIPAGLRNARLQPPRAAVAALLLVLLAAAVILGARVAFARAAATPQPVSASHFGGGGAHAPVAGLVSRSVPSALGGGAAALGPPSPSQPAQPTSASLLWVDVVGQVRRAGVVRLPPGSRVLDAVNAAGGALRGADLASVNLARLVADGEQIVVPRPGEAPRGPSMSGSGPGSLGAAGGGSGADSQVDLNAADATALDTLPGVGPVLAQRILDWRAEHGRFTSVDELGEVSGIGDKLLAQLRPRVRV